MRLNLALAGLAIATTAVAQTLPALPGMLVPLPLLPEKQIRQLVSDIAAQMETSGGYRRATQSEEASPALPPYPPNVLPATVLVRGNSEYVRVGIVMLPRRLPQLWMQGLVLQGEIAIPAGHVVQPVQAAARAVMGESAKIMGRLRLSDLESRSVLLSYVDADAALFVLRAMGYSAITDTEALPRDDWYKGEEASAAEPIAVTPAAPAPAASTSYSSYSGYAAPAPSGPRFPAIKNLPTTINFDRLPLIVRVPSTDARNLGVVGAEPPSTSSSSWSSSASSNSNSTSTTIPSVAQPLSETVAAGTQELLVLYHPDYPEQLQKVRKLLQEAVDRPARQVYIEGLVVEVSRGNLDRLGVQWTADNGRSSLSLGATALLGPAGTALGFFRNELDRSGNVVRGTKGPWNVYANIQALVSEDKAQILSRPSLVTLDNRQATIRVGNDVPVAHSTGANSNIAYSYKSIPTGIMLNVRPRVSEDGQEVSMLIDATVSDTVRGQDLRVVDPDTNAVVVTAPTVSTRRVQTYARIRDSMPLIIGGLMSRSVVKGEDRVPLLGKIPIVGALFGHTQAEAETREVIIVLTPTVVSEDPRQAKGQYPRDDPVFDITGTTLFKEKLRIAAEDVVDGSALVNGERLRRYRDAANRAIDREPALARVAPFAQFAGERVPGDAIFVTGQLSRMLERLNAGEAISLASLRTLEWDAGGSPRLGAFAPRLEAFLERNPGKALAITFRAARDSAPMSELLAESLPEERVVDCPDRDAWRKLLWDLNQPDERGARSTILVHERSDLRRLQLAVATRSTVLANGGERSMTLDFWIAGRMLNVREAAPRREHVVDAATARDFFVAEHYYGYFLQEHLRAMEALERALQAPPAKG